MHLELFAVQAKWSFPLKFWISDAPFLLQRWPAEANGSEMSTRDSKATRRAKPRRRSPV